MSERNSHPIKRQAKREACYAHARFPHSGDLAYVMDITPQGCRFVFQDGIHFKDPDVVVEIMPVSELGIANFEVTVAMHWDHTDPPFHAAGASFVELSPESRAALAALVGCFGKTP